MVRTILAAVMLCAIFMSRSEAQVQQSLNLMPMPAKVQLGNGRLLIDPSFSVAITGHKEPRLDGAVDLFLGQLRRQNQGSAAAGRRRILPARGRQFRRSPERAHHARRHAWTADIPATSPDDGRRLRRAGNFHRRQSAFSLAWIDDRCRTPLYPARRAEAEP